MDLLLDLMICFPQHGASGKLHKRRWNICASIGVRLQIVS